MLFLSIVVLVLFQLLLTNVDATPAVAVRLSPISFSGSDIRGLLAVRWQGNWTNLCDRGGLMRSAAEVVCRQMGYTGKSYRHGLSMERETSIRYIFCGGYERSLNHCHIRDGPTYLCAPFDHVMMTCQFNPALNGLFDVKVIGQIANLGVLEVTLKDGKRAAVCYDSTENATSVSKTVCKQIGYGDLQTTMITSPSNYKGNSFASAYCNGTQPTLAACEMTATTKCTSGKVLGVECKLDIASQQRFDIRLSSHVSSPPGSGTVEVYQYGHWGVICDTEWDMAAANVVCRQLGFRQASRASLDAEFGQGSGTVFWNNVSCSGNEQSIKECKHDLLSDPMVCQSADAVGVVCDNRTLPIIDICQGSARVHSVSPGITFIRSPNYPSTFDYDSGRTCYVNITSLGKMTVYIHNKMFQHNHIEYVTFVTSDVTVTLYGDDPVQELMTYNAGSMMIKFQAGLWTGRAKLNIQLTVTEPTTSTTLPSTTLSTLTTPGFTPTFGIPSKAAMSTDVAGVLGGSIGAILMIVIVVVVGIILWKGDFIRFGKSRACLCRNSDPTPDEEGTEAVGDPPQVIYENLPNEQNTTGPIYVNAGFLGSSVDVSVTDQDNADYDRGSEYEDVSDVLSRRRRQPGTDAARPEMVQVDVDKSGANAGLYAPLESVNRAEYMDFRQLSADQLKPV